MNSNPKLFFSAAIFNWLVALVFLFAYQPAFKLLGITPIPDNPIYLHLFAILVAMFGWAYYQAGTDFIANRNLIELGAIAKIAVFLLPFGYFLVGLISWQLPLLASVDLLYALLFIRALKAQKLIIMEKE
jgi:hypothetical protein